MRIEQMLSDLSARGIGIEADGERLLIHAPARALTDQDRAELRHRKRELLTALRMPSKSELLRICRPATAGLPVDPVHLAAWLVRQRDPQWCHPEAVKRWARYAAEQGSLPA